MPGLGLGLAPALERLWEEQGGRRAVEGLLQHIVTLLLKHLTIAHDLLLSLPAFRRAALFAFGARHRAIVEGALSPPPAAPTSWEALEYWIDPQSRQLLQFVALAALSTHLAADEVLAPAQLLPQVSRALLQTEEAAAGRYLEAVAAALASQMHACLLVVDAMLLASLVSATLGGPPEAYLAAVSGGSSSAGGKAAAKPALAWLALRKALFALDRPTVVFIRNCEALLASSYDAMDAFEEALGSQELLALERTASRAPIVLMGGGSVSESAAARAGVRSGPPGGPEADEDEEDSDAALRSRGRSSLDALEEELRLSDLLLSLSRLAGEAARPNPRRLLERAFPTRVRLQAPPAGPASARHLARLQRDAAAAAEEDNCRAAAAVAASSGVALPPKSSGVFEAPSGKALSRSDWSRALSWAVVIEKMQQARAKLQEEQEEQEQEEQELEVEAGAEAAPAHEAAVAAPTAAGVAAAGAGNSNGTSSPGTPVPAGLRRRRGGGEAPSPAASAEEEGHACIAPQQAPTAALLSLAAGVWEAASPWQLAAAAAWLPWRALQATGAAARWAAVRLPLVGGRLEELLEGRLTAEQLEAELQALEAEMEALDAAPGGGSAGSEGVSRSGGSGTQLRLSELSVKYGLGMISRSSGSSKQAMEPANAYERQLLGEVLCPEDCGRGFEEVGALSEAKAALREAVQLPLKHPELFSGTLARPSKGVLLFGPPGVGKTLVARAAAAECGAAFLPLSPSAVTSKYFGDGPKFIRAAFTLAAKLSPCVIFLDEVDALLGRRNSSKEHEALREMKNELMLHWDGIRPGRERVMLLGATNRPFDLDDAVLRRFTHRIFIGLPDQKARLSILNVVLGGERLAPNADLARVAEQTDGYSGSDLKQVCVQAAMRPVRAFLERDSAVAAANAAPEGQEEEEAEVAGMAPPQAAAPAGGIGAGEPAAGIPGLPMVPRLDSLLRQAKRIASAPANPKTDLRPISMQDFEESLREVGASVSPDSSAVQELSSWNDRFGTAGGKGARAFDKRLSYFT